MKVCHADAGQPEFLSVIANDGDEPATYVRNTANMGIAKFPQPVVSTLKKHKIPTIQNQSVELMLADHVVFSTDLPRGCAKKFALKVDDSRSFGAKVNYSGKADLLVQAGLDNILSIQPSIEGKSGCATNTSTGSTQWELTCLYPAGVLRLSDAMTNDTDMYIREVIVGIKKVVQMTLSAGPTSASTSKSCGASIEGSPTPTGVSAGISAGAATQSTADRGHLQMQVSAQGAVDAKQASAWSTMKPEEIAASIEQDAAKELWTKAGIAKWEVLFVVVAGDEVDVDQSTQELIGILNEPQYPKANLSLLSPEVKVAIDDGKSVFIMMGDTGVGKSSFCGMFDGSLRLDVNLKQWVGNFKVGNSINSQTTHPDAQVIQMFGNGPSAVLMDTAGFNDSRGKVMDQVAKDKLLQLMRGVVHINAIIIVVAGNQERVSSSLRDALNQMEETFSKNGEPGEMWDHAVIVVNKWPHSQDAVQRRACKGNTEDRFAGDFRNMLMQPKGQDGSTDFGVGLSREKADQLRFFFVDTEFQESSVEEKRVMTRVKTELQQTLTSMAPWHAEFAYPLSDEVKQFINEIKGGTLTGAQIQDALTALIAKQPRDWSQKKERAVQRHARRVQAADKIEIAKQAFKDASDAVQIFCKEGDEATLKQCYDTCRRVGDFDCLMKSEEDLCVSRSDACERALKGENPPPDLERTDKHLYDKLLEFAPRKGLLLGRKKAVTDLMQELKVDDEACLKAAHEWAEENMVSSRTTLLQSFAGLSSHCKMAVVVKKHGDCLKNLDAATSRLSNRNAPIYKSPCDYGDLRRDVESGRRNLKQCGFDSGCGWDEATQALAVDKARQRKGCTFLVTSGCICSPCLLAGGAVGLVGGAVAGVLFMVFMLVAGPIMCLLEKREHDRARG